ncbi:MAG: helix-turn-helix domain-containing protein [Planctomycetota bacterium]
MNHPNHLSNNQVREILKLYQQGWGYRNIARIIGRSERSVENVLTGKTHRDVTGGRICNGKRPAKLLAIYQ